MIQGKGMPGRESHQEKEVKCFCIKKKQNRIKQNETKTEEVELLCDELREEVKEMRLGK